MPELANPQHGVATLCIPPGEQDPAALLTSGGFNLVWRSPGRAEETVSSFREVKVPHVVDDGLCLPTLYLHFLDQRFRPRDGVPDDTLDGNMRAGNDMSEVIITLPEEFTDPAFASRCQEHEGSVKIVLEALKANGEVMVNSVVSRDGKLGGAASPGKIFFALTTARPKAPISLPKKLFGIPESADQYLFVNNHASVVYLDSDVREAFNNCIGGLPDVGLEDVTKFGIFLKIFYEGGFGYNKKQFIQGGNSGPFLPKNVGVAALGVTPWFENQLGIGTGYPYKLPSKFLPFTETVPISIDAIKAMSDRHGRYGLCFTRCVFVWEGEAWARDKCLDFCSVLPHGGFFYLPETMAAYREKGGLVYAFGESTEDSNLGAERA